ncbi:hypothetical protein H7H51_31395 [Mycolicibacterium farcinogenes]|nr:hypothetical protein [Mycolicibacterium farcinogenes]
MGALAVALESVWRLANSPAIAAPDTGGSDPVVRADGVQHEVGLGERTAEFGGRQ